MNWLRKRREEVGITSQEELAEKLQLDGFSFTRASISHWENGRNNPPLDDPEFRRVLAKILRVSQPDLLRLAGYEVDRVSRTHEAERAAYIVDQLTPEKRDLAVRLLEELLEH